MTHKTYFDSPGLAKIAAAMANGGTVGGVKVLGEKGWKALHADSTPGGLWTGSNIIYITQVAPMMAGLHLISGRSR